MPFSYIDAYLLASDEGDDKWNIAEEYAKEVQGCIDQYNNGLINAIELYMQMYVHAQACSKKTA